MKEQEGRDAEAAGGAEAGLGALLLLLEATWFGPGEGLLWLLHEHRLETRVKHRESRSQHTVLCRHVQDHSSSKQPKLELRKSSNDLDDRKQV